MYLRQLIPSFLRQLPPVSFVYHILFHPTLNLLSRHSSETNFPFSDPTTPTRDDSPPHPPSPQRSCSESDCLAWENRPSKRRFPLPLPSALGRHSHLCEFYERHRQDKEGTHPHPPLQTNNNSVHLPSAKSTFLARHDTKSGSRSPFRRETVHNRRTRSPKRL